jgi:hypothetical protein
MVVNFISLIAFNVKSETPFSLKDSKLTEVRLPPDGITEVRLPSDGITESRILK